MLTSCEVRIRLTDSEDRLALLVRGSELKRSGRRVLIPFGGAVSNRAIASRIIGTQNPDLRFDASPRQYLTLRGWFDSLDSTYLEAEAMREFHEEACDERGLLTAREVAECQVVYENRLHTEAPSVRNSTLGQPTRYMIAVVQMITSDRVLRKLGELSQIPESLLEFVTPELLRQGGETNFRSKVNTLYAYLL